jgi:hypothetical protein
VTIRSVQDLKIQASIVESAPVARFAKNAVSLVVEILSLMLAAFFVVLDVKLISEGDRIVVHAAQVSEFTTAGIFFQDVRLTFLLQLATFGLLVGAFLLVILAGLLRSARRHRNQVAVLCEGVSKLRVRKDI